MKNFLNNAVKLLLRRKTIVFIVFVLISSMLWYLTKLGHVYIVDIPVKIVIEGNSINAKSLVEGTGYNIVAYRHFINKPVNIPPCELTLKRIKGSDGMYAIDAVSMQRALSSRKSNIKVISVSELPPIELYADTK